MRLTQTIPLSLSILWRFAFTFPVLLIGLFLYGALGGLIGALIGFIFPGTAVITAFLVSASSGVIPVMVGARFGFQSKLIRPSVGYRKLVVPAVVYGVTEAVAIGLVLAPVVGLAIVQAAPDLVELTKVPAEEWLASVGTSVTIPGLAVVCAIFVIASAARASLLVPLAAASLGRDPDGLPYTPFRNFGVEFLPLFTLVALSYLVMTVLYVLTFLCVSMIVGLGTLEAGVQEIAEMIEGSAPVRPVWSIIVLSLSFVVVALWGLSLQCAGGVLGYLRLQSDRTFSHSQTQDMPAPEPRASNTGPRTSAEELRALRKSRQQRD